MQRQEADRIWEQMNYVDLPAIVLPASIVADDLKPFDLRFGYEQFKALFGIELNPQPLSEGHHAGVRVLDIDVSRRVAIRWVVEYTQVSGHDNGELIQFAAAEVVVSTTRQTRILEHWQARRRSTLLDQEIARVEKGMNLDDAAVRRRREEALKAAGLDQATVEASRARALLAAGLDDISIGSGRSEIRARIVSGVQIQKEGPK